MSFGEYFNAFGSLGDAYREGAERAELKQYQQDAADLAGKQLDAYLAQSGGLGALGQMPGAPAGGLSALGAPSTPKLPSFAGGAAPMTLPASTEVENKFVGALKDGGLTNPFGLAAAAAYAKRESGYSPNKITGSWSDPSESGQAGTSGGILSWRADRLNNMRSFTAGAKDPVTAQAKFFLTEDPNTTLALQNAKSPEEANDILAKAWKFAGYNRPGGGEYAARLGTTRAYVNRLAGMNDAPAAAPTQVASATPNGQLPPGASGLNPAFRPPQRPVQFAETEADVQRLEQGMMPAQPSPPPAGPARTLVPQSMAGMGIPGTVMDRGNPVAQVAAQGAPATPVLPPQQQAAVDDQANMPVPGAQPAEFRIPPGGQVPQQAVPSDFVPGTVAAPAIQNGRAQDLPAVQGAPRLSPQQAQFLRAQLVNPLTRPQAIQAIQGLNAPEKWETKELGGRVVQVNGRGDVRALPGFDKPEELTQFKAGDGNDYLLNKRTGQTTRLIQGKDQGYTTLITPEQRAQYGVDPTYKGVVQVGPGQQLHFPGKASTEVNVNQTAEKAQDSKIGGAYGDTFNELQTSGRNAIGQLNTYRLMEKLIDNPNFYSGAQSGPLLAARRAAAALGIKDADAAAPNELFAKLATQSVLDKLGGSLGAGVSNSDVLTMQNTVANGTNTPEGNRQILQFSKALAQRQIEVSKLARQYAGAHGGRLDPGFDDKLAEYAEANPLTVPPTEMQQRQAAQAAAAQSSGSHGAGVRAAPVQVAPSSSPNSGAIDYLRRNPNLRDAFDAKYGRGAADRVLMPAGGGGVL